MTQQDSHRPSRRKIDFDRIGRKILVLLYQQYMNSNDFYVPFKVISEAISNEPRNAVWDELGHMIDEYAVVQRTETRYPSGFGILAGLAKDSKPQPYEAKVDGYKISRSGIKIVNEFSDETFEILASEIIATQPPTSNSKEEAWEPLPLDRQSTEFVKATEAADIALKEIEGSNGYADSSPEERNSIVQTIKTNLDVLKNGVISKGQIIEGLIKPFHFIAIKFLDASMGELAKRAAKFLWVLLGGP